MGFLDSIMTMQGSVTGLSDKAKMLSDPKSGATMDQLVTWAYETANADLPGLGTCKQMAQKYLDQYSSMNEAINSLVNWQVIAAASSGFISSITKIAPVAQALGKAGPVITDATSTALTVIQLRMVGAIAEMGGYHDDTQEKKTGVYLCLLGSQAANALARNVGNKAMSFTQNALSKVSKENLQDITEQVGKEKFTKSESGSEGTGNIIADVVVNVVGGLVNAAVNALSTYAIAEASKAMFLNNIIDFEKQEQIEINRMRILMNMALADGTYDKKEAELLKYISNSLNIYDKAKAMLAAEIDHPIVRNVDLAAFKKDKMNASTLITGLTQLANVDGKIHPAEKMYITMVARELGCQDLVKNL